LLVPRGSEEGCFGDFVVDLWEGSVRHLLTFSIFAFLSEFGFGSEGIPIISSSRRLEW